MKKITLILIFFTSVSLLALAALAFKLYYANDVEVLVKNYPYYDLKDGSYKITSEMPKSWVSVDQVSEEAKWAIIVSEDWAFFDHEGLDTNQIKITIEESLKEHRFVRGASTITQQVIKNTILTSEKSLWRKFREAILAYKVEKYLSKDRILEIYINIIELGKDIYGIKNASYFYFNKAPKDLTAREGAFLAMLLPSPVKYGTSFKKKELTSFAREVVESILVKMRQAQVYSKEEWLQKRKEFFSWEIVSSEYRNDILESERLYREKEGLVQRTEEANLLEKEKIIKIDDSVSNDEYLDYKVYE